MSVLDLKEKLTLQGKTLSSDTMLTGELSHIIYHSPFGGFIGRLVSGKSVKGKMISPIIGMKYEFTGRWVQTSPYPPSFEFGDYISSMPVTAQGIKTFLEMNCDGVGSVLAQRLVDEYKEETLEMLLTSFALVAREVSGMSFDKAQEISKYLFHNLENKKTELILLGLLPDLTEAAVSNIMKVLGNDAPNLIRKNPYVLIGLKRGWGFKFVDNLAAALGISGNDRTRVQEGIKYSYNKMMNDSGSTVFPVYNLMLKAKQELGLTVHSDVTDQFFKMICEESEPNKDAFYFVKYNDASQGKVTSVKYYNKELFIKDRLKTIMKTPATHSGNYDIPYDELNDEQKEAFKLILDNKVFILTGAPGTGKTYTTQKIIQAFMGSKVVLCAPTGKAAKRLTEMTSYPAFTIHKLMLAKKIGTEDNQDKYHLTKNRDDPIDADLIILDEFSMVDIELMGKFLDALRDTTKLILIGDYHQLPSIRPGSLLEDLLNSKLIPSIELKQIMRQEAGLIINNCHNVKNRKNLMIDNRLNGDFFFLQMNNENDIKKKICDMMCGSLKKAYPELDILKDVQIITPYKTRTELSCKALNDELQAYFTVWGKMPFKIGDKVIQTKNDYKKNIMNGDIGYILGFTDIEYLVDFGTEEDVTIPIGDNSLELAYAITCHKFQGSESDIIILPMHSKFYTGLVNNNWLYTAISRARKVCILVGDVAYANKVISQKQDRRETNLRRFLNGLA